MLKQEGYLSFLEGSQAEDSIERGDLISHLIEGEMTPPTQINYKLPRCHNTDSCTLR